MSDETQIPPNAIDVEAAVLGAILLNDSACDEAIDMLTASSFYKIENGHIFDVIVGIKKDGRKADSMTVCDGLKKRNLLKLIGGPVYVSRLTDKIASAEYINQHAQILKQKETLRKYFYLSQRLREKAMNESVDPISINTFAMDQVHEIMGISQLKKEVSNADLADQLVTNMNAASQNKGIVGVQTGFERLDQLTGGNKPGNLIVLAGRPGMGKTAFALCCALNGAIKFKKRMLFFSLEMTALELFKRLASIHIGLDGDKLKKGNLSAQEWTMFNNSLQSLIESSLVIIDDCWTVFEMQTRAKKELSRGGVDQIFIDYIQLIKSDRKGGNRENEVSEISRGCKGMAKELNVPVIALAQLSRSVETRGGDKRPMLSDLRESGSIEQDADIVAFTYRPRYYGIEEEYPGESYLFVQKHRDGSLDDIPLQFIHSQTKFINV